MPPVLIAKGFQPTQMLTLTNSNLGDDDNINILLLLGGVIDVGLKKKLRIPVHTNPTFLVPSLSSGVESLFKTVFDAVTSRICGLLHSGMQKVMLR